MNQGGLFLHNRLASYCLECKTEINLKDLESDAFITSSFVSISEEGLGNDNHPALTLVK